MGTGQRLLERGRGAQNKEEQLRMGQDAEQRAGGVLDLSVDLEDDEVSTQSESAGTLRCTAKNKLGNIAGLASIALGVGKNSVKLVVGASSTTLHGTLSQQQLDKPLSCGQLLQLCGTLPGEPLVMHYSCLIFV